MFTNKQLAIWGGGAAVVIILLLLIFRGDDEEATVAPEAVATDEVEEEAAAETAEAEPAPADTTAEAEPAETAEAAPPVEEPEEAAVETAEPESPASTETAEAPAEPAAETEPEAEAAAAEPEAAVETTEAAAEPEAEVAEPTEPAAEPEAAAETTEAAAEPEPEMAKTTEPVAEPEPEAQTAEAAAEPEAEVAEPTEPAAEPEVTETAEEPAAETAEAADEPAAEPAPAEPTEETAETAPAEPATETAASETAEADADATAAASTGAEADTTGTEMAAVSPEPAAEAMTEEEPGTAAAAPAGPAAAELRIGQGRQFAAGSVSVFLSRIDQEGQRALLALNGTERSWLAPGDTVEAGDTRCRVSVNVLEARSAKVSVDCTPSGAPSAGTAAGPGESTGLGAGQTALLADGKVRAFIAQVDAASDRARIAINGTERSWIEAGESVEVSGTDCTVSLDGIEERTATLTARCGGASAGGGGAAAASALAVGQSASLADGKLRVFLSGLGPERRRARVAVNGYAQRWLRRGAPALIRGTGCRLTLEGIEGSKASLSADCSERKLSDAGAAATLSVGQTAIFDDGTVRLFLSRIDPITESARIAANGTRTSTLARGEPQDMGDSCTAELFAIEEGKAVVVVDCTGSDRQAAGGGTASDAGGGMLSAGQTRLAGDGALRVFVSSVDSATGRARLAINGQERVWVKSGDTVEAGDSCSVTVDRIEGRTVALSADCG